MTTLLHSAGKLSVFPVYAACFAWGQPTDSADAKVVCGTVVTRHLDKNTKRTFTTNSSGVNANAPHVISYPPFPLPDKLIGPGHIGRIMAPG